MSPEEHGPGEHGPGEQGTQDGGGRLGYRYAEQHAPPPPVPVTDVAVTTFEHVLEVDPRLMERWVHQQQMPAWDSLRIVHSRHDHLDWMHRHFADRVVAGSALLREVEAEDPEVGP
ncbi:hypothetical protein [Nocardioides deserti]|uniref:Uncharacterized protein n=1 Tax=Nocardioides deserti TaxID=1588644 RepID=A0ABR6U4I3_9ACTN|nr:hypothetical protein [Nocardioides deserti]MBC2959003.1 hypothetical protein [Nocardioides deserti]GGO69008.1 hypothetical protein GCM10012276_04170 [Nocardioides deserti]